MKSLILKKDANKSFSYLAGINRPINPAQVTKLAKSIDNMGIIRPVVIGRISFIDGKPTNYIIDGQHLFNALLRNNMDIPYIIVTVKDKKDLVEKIALLNASSKNWAMIDYITAWSCISEEYVKLKKYFNVYDIDLGTIASILTGGVSDGGYITRKIKDGSFKVVDEKFNVQVLDCLTDILKVIPRMDRESNRYASREYITFLRTTPNYNHKKFMVNLESKKKDFVLATQEEGKLKKMFVELSK